MLKCHKATRLQDIKFSYNEQKPNGSRQDLWQLVLNKTETIVSCVLDPWPHSPLTPNHSVTLLSKVCCVTSSVPSCWYWQLNSDTFSYFAVVHLKVLQHCNTEFFIFSLAFLKIYQRSFTKFLTNTFVLVLQLILWDRRPVEWTPSHRLVLRTVLSKVRGHVRIVTLTTESNQHRSRVQD